MENVDASGENTQNPSGVENQVEQPEQDAVSYETYQKTLNQAKTRQEKLSSTERELQELKSKLKAQEEQKLQETQQYKELWEKEREEKEAVKSALDSTNKSLVDSYKLDAVVGKLPCKVKKPEYFNFIDLDNVVWDEETRTVVPESVELVASNFIENYGTDMLDWPSKNKLPNDAADRGESVSYEQWKNMNLADKKKNYDKVFKKKWN